VSELPTSCFSLMRWRPDVDNDDEGTEGMINRKARDVELLSLLLASRMTAACGGTVNDWLGEQRHTSSEPDEANI